MSELRVIGRDGSERRLEAFEGGAVMDTLRDAGTGILGTCGGACSCGTCHVYVAPEWLDRLPAKGEDETMMLEAIGELVPLRAGSRLACQLPMTAALSGLVLEIAPEL